MLFIQKVRKNLTFFMCFAYYSIIVSLKTYVFVFKILDLFLALIPDKKTNHFLWFRYLTKPLHNVNFYRFFENFRLIKLSDFNNFFHRMTWKTFHSSNFASFNGLYVSYLAKVI